MRRRVLLAPAALVALSLALTGCQPGLLAVDEAPLPAGPSAEPTETSPASDPAVSPPSEGEPSEVPTQVPVEVGEGVDFTCEQVFTLEQLYEFDPNFTPTDDPGRELPPVFAAIGDDDGIVCAYRHVTGDAVLLVGVAPGSSDASAGYTNEVGIGTTAVASGDHLIAVGSTYFGSAGDADPLIQQVAGNIGD